MKTNFLFVLVLLAFGPLATLAYQEESPFGSREFQENLSREMRASEKAYYDRLHAHVSARIEAAFGLPPGSMSVHLTDDYGSYISAYIYTSRDRSVQCAMVSFRQGFSVNCNGRPMFVVRR